MAKPNIFGMYIIVIITVTCFFMTFPGLVSRLEYCFIRMPSRPSFMTKVTTTYKVGRHQLMGRYFVLFFASECSAALALVQVL